MLDYEEVLTKILTHLGLWEINPPEVIGECQDLTPTFTFPFILSAWAFAGSQVSLTSRFFPKALATF